MKGVLIVMIGLLSSLFGADAGSDVRMPSKAGSWYPGNAKELAKAVDTYLEEAVVPDIEGDIVGLVSPHAGYIYSGPVAGYSYKLLKGRSYELVVLIGNAHRVGFPGAAVDGVKSYRTPLGDVPVAIDEVSKLISAKNSVIEDSNPHRDEHSLELQIPFLQRTLKPGFKIIPILFGYNPGNAYRHIVETISKMAADKSVLLVASTDLTHFPSYEESCRIDQLAVDAIASMDISKLEKVDKEEMSKNISGLDCVLCGKTATEAVMEISRNLGADQGVVLRRANSGDVAIGDKHSVVGYGSVVFIDNNSGDGTTGEKDIIKGKQPGETDQQSDDNKLSEHQEKYILGLSRNILDTYVKTGKVSEVEPKDEIYSEKRGVFVTLKIRGLLRGCIGYIFPEHSMLDAVIQNTVNACSKDPRFPPVKPGELDDIDIEVSILTPPREISSYKEIEVGRHGVVLKKSFHQAVFLPQVAPEQGWDCEEMLRQLSYKAGLPPDGWKNGTKFEVFEAQVFGEKELGRQSFKVE